MTAGYLLGKVSGQGWEGFVQQHIFQPLHMTASNFSQQDLQKSSDFSRPYRENEDTQIVSEIPFHAADNIGPAGSINSNVEDMARYAIFQLGNGKVNGIPIVSESNLSLTHSPQVPMGGAGLFKEIGPQSYGMGWVNTSYRGHQLVWHNGGIDGFYALVSMLPDEHLGVVILTNLLGHPVPEIVAYNVFDRLLGLDSIDWSTRFQQLEAKQKASEEDAKKSGTTNRKLGTRPSHDLNDYVGRYQNPGYGDLTIQPVGNGFTATLNKISVPLQHYHYDVFQVPEGAHWILEKTKLRFLTNMDGDIDSIAIPLEEDAPEIIFARAAEKLPREALLPLVGDYELGAVVVSVALKDDELQLIIPGQPIDTLVPQKDLKFTLKGLTGFSVEFHKDSSGALNELAFFQPNGSFIAKRKAVH